MTRGRNDEQHTMSDGVFMEWTTGEINHPLIAPLFRTPGKFCHRPDVRSVTATERCDRFPPCLHTSRGPATAAKTPKTPSVLANRRSFLVRPQIPGQINLQ